MKLLKDMRVKIMNIAKLIDHTILKANTTKEDVMKVIRRKGI